MMPMKAVLSALSPPADRGRLSILIFHRVLPAPDPLFPGEVDAQQFDQIVGWVCAWCNVLPLDEACVRLVAGTLPSRAVAITFDDGYADNHDQALPILRRHGVSATFFVATGFLDGGRMWNDTVIEAVRHCTLDQIDLRSIAPFAAAERAVWPIRTPTERALTIQAILGAIKYMQLAERLAVTESLASYLGVKPADDLMMTGDQVRLLRRQGMQIGAHTCSHPILAGLKAEQAREEIAVSKSVLEGLLGERVDLFAYPNGRPGQDYSEESVAIVRELGFSAAVSTAAGAARAGSDPFQLPRFTPWDRTKGRFGVRFARNLWQS